jgi:dTDP-4-amino-4,6-dideoxygalactose transaminase
MSLKAQVISNVKWSGISERTVSIPLSPKLTDEDVEDVIKAVTEIMTEN